MAIRTTADYKIKPATPYKSVITPSSLYKGNCPRCTWMSYWHNFSIPANLALQQQMIVVVLSDSALALETRWVSTPVSHPVNPLAQLRKKLITVGGTQCLQFLIPSEHL